MEVHAVIMMVASSVNVQRNGLGLHVVWVCNAFYKIYRRPQRNSYLYKLLCLISVDNKDTTRHIKY